MAVGAEFHPIAVDGEGGIEIGSSLDDDGAGDFEIRVGGERAGEEDAHNAEGEG